MSKGIRYRSDGWFQKFTTVRARACPLQGLLSGALVLMTILVAGCGRKTEPAEASHHTPELRNEADSLAWRTVQGHGGLDAWSKVRYLRFDYATESEGSRSTISRHLWDRHSGDYRLEWFPGEDTTVVALFNVNDRTGNVFINGAASDAAAVPGLLESAYRRFINDTYWLLAPLKVFDEGVMRRVVHDSSTSEVEVLALSFDNVGLTPGDRYWLAIDRSDGLLRRWSYILQGWGDQPASTLNWLDYTSFETPAGTIRLAERKQRPGSHAATITDVVALPTTMPSDVFTDDQQAMD